MTAVREQLACDGRPDLVFDFVRPESATPAPLLVFIHGGGWISGDRTMYADEAVWAAQLGFASACVSYRLAPLHPFPAAVADVQAFVRHARRHHAELGVDPTKIVAMGNSAGGHLAAMAGLCPTDLGTGEPAERADAVVCISGISDLREPDTRSLPIAMSFVEQFMGGSYGELSEQFAKASPLAYVDSQAPPFLVYHGDDDEIVPVEQSRALAAALREAGAAVDYHEMTGEGHSYTFTAWEEIRRGCAAFVRGL
ncbi:MAG: alpha/beta hydrolase [Armatimonadetes bacterium]|nr:alpha/beta hydrolase [Armatimonadota bacterium]